MTPAAERGEVGPVPCERCNGTGFQLEEKEGYSYAVRCDCRVSASTSVAGLPPRFLDARFDTFAAQTRSLKQAKKVAEEFVRHYPAVERGLFLVGPEGVGKTHLASAVLSGLAERGFPGLYYDYRELLRSLRGTFDREAGLSTRQILDPIMNAELVVLDGVGDEAPTEWVNDTLSLIVNHRYNYKRTTIATSRYLDSAAVESRRKATRGRARHAGMEPAEPTLEERIGTSLLSRFYEMCQFICIDGVDFRVHIKKEAFPR